MADKAALIWMPKADEDVARIRPIRSTLSKKVEAELKWDEEAVNQYLADLKKRWADSNKELGLSRSGSKLLLQSNRLQNQVQEFIGMAKTISDLSKLSEFLMSDSGIDDCIRWRLLTTIIDDFDEEEKLKQGRLKDGGARPDNFPEDPITCDPRQVLLGILLQEAPHLCFECSSEERLKRNCINRSVHHVEFESTEDDIRNYFTLDRIQSDGPSKDLKTPLHQASQAGLSFIVEAMIQLGFHAFRTKDVKQGAEVRSMRDSVISDGGVDEESHLRMGFATILRKLDGKGKDAKTALNLASRARRLQVVDTLLDFHFSVAYDPDQTFVQAVDRGEIQIVQKFLENKDLRQHVLLKRIENSGELSHQTLLETTIISSITVAKTVTTVRAEKGEKFEEFHKDCMNVAKRLLILACDESCFDEGIAEKIVEVDMTELWDLVPESVSRAKLLQSAVRFQREWFVDEIVRYHPSAVTHRQKESDKYVLWYNNYDAAGVRRDNPSSKIRATLVETIIRGTRKMEELAEILYKSGEPVRELCFDLSRFNSKSYRLFDFAKSLINYHENAQLLSYESLIKYAEFPALDLHPEDREKFDDQITREHQEIFDILDWLHDEKGVKTILELQVRDRLFNPHEEIRIADCVDKFGVEILNWRFLDLSISEFEESTKARLTGLHLYASGKRAAISHWLSAEGIKSLPKLKNLDIHIVQDLLRTQQCKDLQRHLRKQFKKVGGVNVNIDIQPWNPKSMDRIRDLDEIGKRAVPKLFQFIEEYRKYVEDDRRQMEKLPKWIEGLEKRKIELSAADVTVPENSAESNARDLAVRQNRLDDLSQEIITKQKQLDDLKAKPFRPTKVAILDDGILSIPPAQQTKSNETNGLWSRIKEGRSFVDDADRSSPWLFASDPHGTQMANLICAIDPLCDLYVAKITEGRLGVSPGRVAKAIEWAIEKKVDIISMSFAVLEDHIKLRNQIAEAEQAGIVMLASTHDEGLNHHKAYPANYDGVFCITTCDEYGTLPQNPPVDYDYRLHGTNISAGVIPYLVSDDRISGSSVATAIAAGVSSLILGCDRLVSPGKEYGTKTTVRKHLIKKHLDSMDPSGDKSKERGRYVVLEKLAGFNARNKDGERVDLIKLLKAAFADLPGDTGE